MHQMQPFPTDAYQSRCAGIGNLGIATGLSAVSGGTGKHYKVHGGNNAFGNFNNYMHHGGGGSVSEAEARGMTRIVFNGNNRNDFHCGVDNFQNCITGEILDNTGNYQLNFVNANGNMRYTARQHVNPSFQGGDGQMQRCYIQRPQGQQARFVRVQQGSKMRPNLSFRNFNNNQQRQKQNRRFITKGFNNNYKTQQKGNNTVSHHDSFEDVESDSLSKRSMQQQQFLDASEQETGRKVHQRHSNHESPQQKTTKGHRVQKASSSKMAESYNQSRKYSKSPLLEPKVEYCSDAMHDLSYDDISENSDDNDDSDLRERLMRKKQAIKREPGELDSDDDEGEALREKGTSYKRKSRKRPASDDISKRFKNAGGTLSGEVGKSKETRKSQRKKDSEKTYSHEAYSSSYSGSGHDNRFTPPRNDSKPPVKNQTHHKSDCSGSNEIYSTRHTDAHNNHCCPEDEVAELKEKVSTMKQSLREAQDKLLEANVVASKKSLRMQEEIAQLKKQLDEATKSENELKVSLKTVEDELSAKNAELTKLSVMNEVEKQDKAKYAAEISRTYKHRLAIEVEKLRALFDVEVAKMQAFYMSSNIYDDDTNMQFTEASSDANHQQNQNNHSPQNEMPSTSENDGEAENTQNQSSVDAVSHREYPFFQQTYFPLASPHTSAAAMPIAGTMPFSLFENVMAYNSLIHHQHVYAQTTAAAASGNCLDATGNNNVHHSRM